MRAFEATQAMPLYALTIFISSFLLFLIQPLIAKQILPWFGGSAAVWSTCLAFFQFVLLAGYAYSDWTTRKLAPRTQAILHTLLLAAGMLTLPVLAQAGWKPAGGEDPALRILGLLCATIGLPYFLLATTGPLVQAWFARTFPIGTVYRLFALSNFASLLALVSYPFAIEPWVSTAWQAYAWSIAFAAFALLCMGTALYSMRLQTRFAAVQPAINQAIDGPAPTWREYALWLTLPALGTWMLLAITNHITQNIASIPFLWLLPLTLYLVSFIICFEHERWYRRWIFVPLLLPALGVCAYGLQSTEITLNIMIAIPLYLAGLFTCCMFCHGELAAMKPAPRHLTTFYLMISLGGAIGGLLVGVAAPRLFQSYYELGAGFVVMALVAGVVLRRAHIALQIFALGVCIACGYFFFLQVKHEYADTRVLQRNFYGTLRTRDTGPASDPNSMRRLIHGVIMHGEQYLAPERRDEPTSYYGPDSGIGIALRLATSPKRAGIIGLGAGTLAVYGDAGDVFRFYDINPQVIDIAQREFSFLKDSAAQIETVLGDARLNLEREPAQRLDVLAIDAFSSDAIPVHLITREAMAVYLQHVKPDGIIAFHVTNRFLKLAPVVQMIAGHYGLASALIIDDAELGDLAKSDWVLVSRDRKRLERSEIASVASPIETIPSLRIWTDSYNNLFQILK
jgi:SAM-dependent methyltransferase